MQFRNEYYFLSNMYESPVSYIYEGKEYNFRCVEAAFQAMKCPRVMHVFEGMNGFDAKKAGRTVELRPDWLEIRDEVMEYFVTQKFENNPTLLDKLKKIEGVIEETNTWNDTYWGVCNGVGQNKLGKILMKIRDK